METTRTKNTPAGCQRGITLIELCIVVAVTAIVAAEALPSFAGFIEARRLDSAATRLAADLQFVRGEAVARNRPVRLSFQAGDGYSCWIAHTGNAAQCQCAGGDGPAVCTGGAAEIKTVVLPSRDRVAVTANAGSLLFDPLHGTVTPTGTLRLADSRGRAIHHVVNVVGRVRSCSPAGAASGFPAC